MVSTEVRTERALRSAFFLHTIVFVGGLTSIGIEIAASRLIAPYFGNSTFIWANVIGLTLAYLSVGYYLGGKLADRYPSEVFLYCLTAIAAAFTGFIPFLARPILNASLNAFDSLSVGAFYGSLVAVILLFLVPITLLGCVSPLAIRLKLRGVEQAGNTAGSLYALSTIGSIAGSFLPVLVLIPFLGTYQTFYTLALLLLAVSILALARLRAAVPALVAAALIAAVVLVALFGARGVLRRPESGTLLYEGESEYNYIQVVQNGDERDLVLNDGHATHSIYNTKQLLTEGPWDYFMIAPFFNADERPADVRSLCLIGLAGGTTARQFTAVYGPIPIDGVEIDPKIVQVGREYFDMTEPNLNVIVQDGRYFLKTTNRRYDVIGVDAYRQPYIPFQLTTKEFFQEGYDHLTDDGVMVLNAGRFGTDYRLVNAVATTMKAVFPHVYIIDVARFSNSMVIATKQPTTIADFEANVARLAPGSPLRVIGDLSVSKGKIREWHGGGLVFTDNRAPVEQVIDQIIINAAREETEHR
ncbi:MAG TPA: fused MFS/spermidine synthase [Thermomicrobiales bacterium]|nr:fused MFS/spermidine synthase [Thermomicrobiales bacterium]